MKRPRGPRSTAGSRDDPVKPPRHSGATDGRETANCRPANPVAERLRVEAAGETIKARRADFYPNVDLVAFAGFQRLGPGALISAGEHQLGVGPALDLPLFDAGRRRAQLAGADRIHLKSYLRVAVRRHTAGHDPRYSWLASDSSWSGPSAFSPAECLV